MVKLNSIIRIWSEDGAFLFACRVGGYPFRKLRNRMLAAKLGVRRLQIGSGSYLRGLSAVQMGENFFAGQGFWLEAVTFNNNHKFNPRIVIGDNVSVSFWSHIAATNYVEIGDNCLLGSKVIITDHNHGQYGAPHTSPIVSPALRPLDSDKVVIIGRNVWLGDGVVVTPGANIGEGSVIGANSVVGGTIPPFTVAAGVPAKPLKKYDFELKQWINFK
jgi:lipopolysaccharide O-acetyltransferase